MSTRLPRAALAWIVLITCLGTMTLVLGVQEFLRLTPLDWTALALFSIAVVIADTYRVHVLPYHVSITVSTVLYFGAVLTFGQAAVVLALGCAAADVVLRKAPVKIIFNAANWSLAVWCSALVWETFTNPVMPVGIETLRSATATAAWLLAGIVFVFINAFAVTIVVALAERANVRNVVRSSFEGIVTQFLTLPTLGVLVAVLYKEAPIAFLIVALPLVAVHYSLKNVEDTRRQTSLIIERIADLLERRDVATVQHSERVAQYTRLICEEMQLPTDLADTVVSAARVHDIGKIGVPDRVLFKPGKLTDQEWGVIKRHPVDGADILAVVTTYAAGTRVVRHHHERWDGKGYPDGLSGEAIPLGARIVAVADAYDAMSSRRVYRNDIDESTILAEIRRQSGAQFDPLVVDAFLEALGARSPNGVLERFPAVG